MIEHCNLMSMYIYSKSIIYFSECRSTGHDIFSKLIPLLPHVFPSFLTSVNVWNVSEQNWSRCQLLYFLWNINSSLTELSWWYCNENKWILRYDNLRFCKHGTVQKSLLTWGLLSRNVSVLCTTENVVISCFNIQGPKAKSLYLALECWTNL